MALETSVNESNWVLQSRGTQTEITSSAGTLEIVYFQWTVETTEHKYFALTVAAADAYITDHPELNLTFERDANFSGAATLTKRSETRTLISVTTEPPPSP